MNKYSGVDICCPMSRSAFRLTRCTLSLCVYHFYQIIIYVATSVNASGMFMSPVETT